VRPSFFIAALFTAAGTVAGQSPVPIPPATPPNIPPTTKVISCTTSGCHAKQLDHKFLHGPTAVSACDVCHEYADPARHTFTLKHTGKDLCSFCHMDKTGLEGPVVHAPVAKGECTGCHDPHGSGNKLMLVRDSIVETCTTCHTTTINASHVHGPAASDCTACHKAHTADHKQLLTMEPRALCLSCHEQVAASLGSAPHVHPPVADDCLSCHASHASNEVAILKAPPRELCISCHQKVADAISAASHPHSAVSDARACLNCHVSHTSKHANLLHDDPATSCLECHKTPIKTDTRTVAGVPEIANPKLHKHGPVATGDCNACHGVHGAQQPQLLVQNYAPGFYQAFSEESYALCFKCHDKSLVRSEATSTDTGFRDAERNLHFVHVAKGAQGRSCRSCHTVHASRYEQQIAQTVNYGQWKLPIGFTPSPDGGTCATGCHAVKSYDRRPLDARTIPSSPPQTQAPAPPVPVTPGGR
jgi:predicted CXXCH cytochrome family protein